MKLWEINRIQENAWDIAWDFIGCVSWECLLDNKRGLMWRGVANFCFYRVRSRILEATK